MGTLFLSGHPLLGLPLLEGQLELFGTLGSPSGTWEEGWSLSKGASCLPGEGRDAGKGGRGQTRLPCLSATPSPGFLQSTALLNSPSSPRAVVREHGEGQPAQCLEDAVRGQHLPGTACLRSLPPQHHRRTPGAPGPREGWGLNRGASSPAWSY